MASERESRQQSIWEHREPEGGPEQPAPAPPEPPGEPRLQAVNRQQMAWRAVDVEQLIAEDHPARAIWQLVGKLDLSSRARSAGQGLSRFWLDTSPSQLDGKWLPIPFRLSRICSLHQNCAEGQFRSLLSLIPSIEAAVLCTEGNLANLRLLDS